MMSTKNFSLHPEVDVIIPNYNKVNYIRECLESLTNQTFTNWRCVVIDGYSNDGSWEIIQRYAKDESRVEVHQYPRRGLYNAWNFGLRQVQSPYFCILTSDDIWPKGWLSAAVGILKENKSLIAAGAQTWIIDEASRKIKVAPYTRIGELFYKNIANDCYFRPGIVDCIANYFLGPIYTSIHSLVFRNILLERGEKFSEDLGSSADYQWYLRLGLYGDIYYYPEIEVGWRVYSEQATNPLEQEVNGQNIRKIHTRNQESIACHLGRAGEAFKRKAEEYDNSVLSYHYGRPSLTNLRRKPLLQTMKLVLLAAKFPGALFTDIKLKATGKTYFEEESLATAEQMTKLYNSLYII